MTTGSHATGAAATGSVTSTGTTSAPTRDRWELDDTSLTFEAVKNVGDSP